MKCPYCAEEIQPEAKKCRYCGEWLTAPAEAASSSLRQLAGSIEGIALTDDDLPRKVHRVSPSNAASTPPIPTATAPTSPKPQASASLTRAGRNLLIGVVGLCGIAIIGALTNGNKQPSDDFVALAPVPTPTLSPGQKFIRAQQEKRRLAQEKARAAALEKQRIAQERAKQREIRKQRQAELRRKRRAQEALAEMRSSRDEVNEITFYEHWSAPEFNNSRNAICLYFGKGDSYMGSLRLKIYYVSDDWLFVEKYVIKADDNTFTVDPEYNEVNRDNSGGGIWEWYDKLLTKDDLELIQAIIKSKKCILRYEGQQYYKDKVIDSTEKQAMKEVLETFLALGGTV